MPIEITMPALSPTMEEGNLAKWLVKEGDAVSSGDVIAEIETDKATMEVEAVDEGTVAKILVAAGTEGVKVNSVIALLAEEGEDVEAAAKASPAPAAPKSEAPTPKPEPETPPSSPGASEETVPPPAASLPATRDGNRVFASPLARRIAADKGIDLTSIKGSGPKGRIVKADVENLAAGEGRGTGAAVAAGAAPVARSMSDDKVLALFDEQEYELKPHDGMRKTIAARLTESSQTIPVYMLSVECNLDGLLALRKEINSSAPTDEDGKPAFKLSVNDFLIKALALALRDVPMANASWTATDRILHKHSDVGVAVAIPDGLITPIVRKAEIKTLSVISAEVKDLAGRARDKKLKPNEYEGGTTAISNLGMFGVSAFTSIINPPHASIVSIGAGVEKPVVRDGAVAVSTLMDATFAFDHRVIDGAVGAQLAGAFRNYVENPMGMLV